MLNFIKIQKYGVTYLLIWHGMTFLKPNQRSKITFLTTCLLASNIKCLLAHKQIGTVRFKAILKKKIVKCTSWQKTLSLQNQK